MFDTIITFSKDLELGQRVRVRQDTTAATSYKGQKATVYAKYIKSNFTNNYEYNVRTDAGTNLSVNGTDVDALPTTKLYAYECKNEIHWMTMEITAAQAKRLKFVRRQGLDKSIES